MRYFILLISLTLSLNAHAYQNFEIDYSDLSDYEKNEVTCLAQNIFFESNAEPTKGKIAVGMVTMNRTNHTKYPSSVCGVVKQKVKGTCQFSWVCDKTLSSRKWKIMQTDSYKDILKLSTYIYLRYASIKDVSNGATHFHAKRINPGWYDLKRTVSIGQHVFYRPKNT